ncbi:hypothetical protein Tco_0556942 [Tanacetum coccineum]
MKASTSPKWMLTYEGLRFLTIPSPKKVVGERRNQGDKDKRQTNFQGELPLKSYLRVYPLPISIPEPDVPKTLPKTIPESDIPKSLPKPNILYPSRRDDQKSRDKASNQMEKIF